MTGNRVSRRDFMLGALSAALAFGCAKGSSGNHPKREKVNVLYIMSDDHATNAISCYGSRLAEIAPTPNIDRIANEGMRLNNCFCTNSICVPSRATILTGLYSHMNGVYTLQDTLDPERQNCAKILRSAGYQTAIIGKWHLKSKPSGFEHWKILHGQGEYFNPTFSENEGIEKSYQGHSTDIITDLTIDWLDNRDANRPFFMMCHFKAPHENWEYPKRFGDYLEDVDIPEPESLWEDKSHRSEGSRDYGFTIDTMAERLSKPDYHSDGPVDFSGLSDTRKRKKAYQVFLKRYLRTITAVDENIGRLLDYLDRTGLAENTVIIYTSDQGYFLGEHNYIDKRWIFEESLKMPFLIRYPAEISPGSVSDEIIINTDFFPTFLDFAGVESPDNIQGRSFRGILNGNPAGDWREEMYYRYWQHTNRPAHYGIRTKKYKLIFYYGLPLGMSGTSSETSKAGWELYDLQKDPGELNNLYNDPDMGKIITELKDRLQILKEKLGDTDEKYPELMEIRKNYRD